MRAHFIFYVNCSLYAAFEDYHYFCLTVDLYALYQLSHKHIIVFHQFTGVVPYTLKCLSYPLPLVIIME